VGSVESRMRAALELQGFADPLARLGRDLDELGRPWALVGALAVAARAETRSPLVASVAVAVEGPADTAALVAALLARGYLPQGDHGAETGSLAVPMDGHSPSLRLELMTSLAGVAGEVARAAERLPVLSSVELPVALRGDLIALGLLAAGDPVREHLLGDVRALLVGAARADLLRCREVLALLTLRGATRAGVLEGELADLAPSSG